MNIKIKEASSILGISEKAVRDQILKGNLPGKKNGKSWVIQKEDCEKLLNGYKDNEKEVGVTNWRRENLELDAKLKEQKLGLYEDKMYEEMRDSIIKGASTYMVKLRKVIAKIWNPTKEQILEFQKETEKLKKDLENY